MLSPAVIQDKLERILLQVQKPGRYVGGELNQVIKPWNQVKTHVALVFPEIYDLGVSNLGLAILYDTLNKRDDVLAERAYSPWVDMEELMRNHHIPLYSLETKHPLSQFDIIGISLPYENLYTNTLNILDLADIPLLSSQRGTNHPLVIAGGHSAFNPEPMADFIDAFVIGEGEEVIHEIVNVHEKWKFEKSSRRQLLLDLSKIWGVYVPSLYEVRYYPDGTILSIENKYPNTPTVITKRIVAKLPPPPTRIIVPSIDVVHNRVAVEIMRGCTRGCRFCHAGMVTRPVRERPVDEIIDAIQETLNQTGFEEIALLSLSSSDYTNIIKLVETLVQNFSGQNLRISLPSLRIDSFSVDLMETIKGSRPGGFTLAPETATNRMREIINKPIQTDQLLDTAREIYKRGWLTIKLYFMVGHPAETLDDVKAIAGLCKAVINEGRKTIGRRAKLNISVSTFVPKAHTPFQWVPCDTLDKITMKQKILQKELRGPGIKLKWTDPRETLLESMLSRGDRRLGKVIMGAWKHGAKFDAWQEKFNFQAWQLSLQENNIDPEFYTHRERSINETFPWDHINTGVSKEFLTNDFMKSLDGETRLDCRHKCFHCGILSTFSKLRIQNPGNIWECPEIKVKMK